MELYAYLSIRLYGLALQNRDSFRFRFRFRFTSICHRLVLQVVFRRQPWGPSPGHPVVRSHQTIHACARTYIPREFILYCNLHDLWRPCGREYYFNILAPELFFLTLAHPVYKMWIIQEPNTLELWNKLHFEEEKNWEFIPCLKYSVPIFVE